MTHKEMIKHFWRETQRLVLQPIRDSSGQSIHVDDYLDEANSSARQRVSYAAKSIAENLIMLTGFDPSKNRQELLEL